MPCLGLPFCLLQTFDNNCAACHAGGNNSVIPDHTLRRAAIEQFLDGGFNLEAITYQVSSRSPAVGPSVS
jgi:cytochrome c6